MNAVTRRPRRSWALTAGSICLLLASCGSGGGPGAAAGAEDINGASVQELYQAARDAGENEVVVYGIKTETACYDEFSQRFKGIQVKPQYMVGETQARLQQEYVSHQNVGDLLRTGDTTMLALIKQGVLSPFVPAGADAIPKAAFGPGQAMINDTQRLGGIAYNTRNLSPSEAPRSWVDLADPRFKGKIVMPDPTSPGAGLSVLQALLNSGGTTDEDWLRRLAANEPALIKGTQPAIEALKTGEYDVMLGGLDQVTGPPVEQATALKFVFPVEGATPITKHYIGLITNAPHPNAAKLLETWLLSEEGQRCLAEKEGEYPVRKGTAPPGEMPAFDELDNPAEQKAATYAELDEQTAYLKQFKELFRS